MMLLNDFFLSNSYFNERRYIGRNLWVGYLFLNYIIGMCIVYLRL